MTTEDKPIMNRLLPWVVLLLAALALLYFLGRGCEGVKNRPQDATGADTSATLEVSTASGPGGAVKSIDLPGGKKLKVAEGASIARIAEALMSGTINPNTSYTLDAGDFQGKSATLTRQSETELEMLAGILNAYPAAKIRIEAHTDSSGNSDINMQLSTQQALAIQSFLKDRGIEAPRVAIAGRGQLKPLVANDTEEGRAQNRRVDVYLVP